MFDSQGEVFFDIKTEYHKLYFVTMRRLLGLHKAIKGSFISEHMVFHTKTVKWMIEEIELNAELEGNGFVEKTLWVVASVGYNKLSFSEFETYRTYVYTNFPGFYNIRKWKSLRRGGWYFEVDQLGENLRRWLSQYYDAISFEKGSVKKNLVARVINHEK